MVFKFCVFVFFFLVYLFVVFIFVNFIILIFIFILGFEGNVWVFVKDYVGDYKEGDGKEYFENDGRGGMMYGIVVKGKFI